MMKNKPKKYRVMHMNKGYQVHGLFLRRKWSWSKLWFKPYLQWKALDAQGETGNKAEDTFYRKKSMAIQAVRRIEQLKSIM